MGSVLRPRRLLLLLLGGALSAMLLTAVLSPAASRQLVAATPSPTATPTVSQGITAALFAAPQCPRGGLSPDAIVSTVTYPAGWNLVGGPIGSCLYGATAVDIVDGVTGQTHPFPATAYSPTTVIGGMWAYLPSGGHMDLVAPSPEFEPEFYYSTILPVDAPAWGLWSNTSPYGATVVLSNADEVLTYDPTTGYQMQPGFTIPLGHAGFVLEHALSTQQQTIFYSPRTSAVVPRGIPSGPATATLHITVELPDNGGPAVGQTVRLEPLGDSTAPDLGTAVTDDAGSVSFTVPTGFYWVIVPDPTPDAPDTQVAGTRRYLSDGSRALAYAELALPDGADVSRALRLLAPEPPKARTPVTCATEGPSPSPILATATYAAGWNLVNGTDGSCIHGASMWALPEETGRQAGQSFPINQDDFHVAGQFPIWVYFPTGGTMDLVAGNDIDVMTRAGVRREVRPDTWVIVGNPSPYGPATVVSGAQQVLVFDPVHGFQPATEIPAGYAAAVLADDTGEIVIHAPTGTGLSRS